MGYVPAPLDPEEFEKWIAIRQREHEILGWFLAAGQLLLAIAAIIAAVSMLVR